MKYLIYLKIKNETYQKFSELYQQLLQPHHEESLAQPLGENLAEISCEIIEQVFGVIARSKANKESEKTLQHIIENLQKYMPWSISLFANDRLLKMVEYLNEQIREKENAYYLTYEVDEALVEQMRNLVEQIQQGNSEAIQPAFKFLTDIVDQGVTALIRDPKKMLKFNFVIDKTLNSVIRLTTQIGYKRIEKISTQFDLDSARESLEHFMGFIVEVQE